jgi:actin, other eukaryote
LSHLFFFCYLQTLLVESVKPGATDKLKWAELLFDTFHVPSLCFASPAPLAIYSSGRTTGVVVDCGASLTSTTPVFDGLPLAHAVNIFEFGGQDISASIRRFAAEQDVVLEFSDAKLLKEKFGYVKVGAGSDVSDDLVHNFELPDGKEVRVQNKILTDSTELLCVNQKLNPRGLIAQVYDSVRLCDDSILNDMANNIIIAGGTSMMRGEF